MKENTFHVAYLLLLNLVWISGFALIFASGHHIYFANSTVKETTLMMAECLANTIFLALYSKVVKTGLKFVTLFFQIVTITFIIYFTTMLLSDGFTIGQLPLLIYVAVLLFLWFRVTYSISIQKNKAI